MITHNKVKKIAVVGGSIAGSIIAIVLDRLGYDITIYEKSTCAYELANRGAGVMLPNELVTQLKEKKILDSNFPCMPVTERPIYTYDTQTKEENELICHSISSLSTHWANLYAALCQIRPENKIKYQSEVTGIKQCVQGVELEINHQEYQYFDFCFFADGYNSLGRQYLFPAIQSQFVDYIAWRGTLQRMDQKTSQHVLNKALFYVFERGHLLIYPIANLHAKNPEKDYIINWVLYESVASASHELFQGDRVRASQNMVKGKMPIIYHTYLQKLAEKYFPAFAKEIILMTKEPFVQAVHDWHIPQYRVGDIALIGDASILLRPHVGAGATKALQDALALDSYLTQESDFHSALNKWNIDRHIIGEKLFKLGQNLGDLFVTKVPNWTQLSKAQMDSMWNAVISGQDWYIANKPNHNTD